MIIREGEAYPKWYGKAWVEWDLNVTIAYPIPFNSIARWFRDFYFWLRCYSVVGYRETIEREAYRAGLEKGNRWIRQSLHEAYEEGFKLGQQVKINE